MLYKLVEIADNKLKEGLEKSSLAEIIAGIAFVYFIYIEYQVLSRLYRMRNNQTYRQRLLNLAYQYFKYVPAVKNKVNHELAKTLQSTHEKLRIARQDMNLKDAMPVDGVSSSDILKEFGISVNDCAYDFVVINEDDRRIIIHPEDGKDSGALYAAYPRELKELLKEIFSVTALTNPMHDKWVRMSAMEAEVIRWSQQLFHGDKEAYGIITHGGTGSIIEAMAAYVLYARANGINAPEIVIPATAHAAFLKAATLTGAELVVVPVNPATGAVTADEMRRYISHHTAVLVASAPSFMNGIADPISDIGKLAQEYKIPFHVDACLGGFLTAFLDTAEAPMDFRVPGVTSISADFHKYGLCPKGSSVCLFSEDSPANSVYAALDWSGGLYATSGILDGSRSGVPVAMTYAIFSYFGQNRFASIAQEIVALRETIQTTLAKALASAEDIDAGDLKVYSDPRYSVIGFRSEKLNVLSIADEMDKKGWKLNLLQNPDGFHLCLTMVHVNVENFAKGFVYDLMASVRLVKDYAHDHVPTRNVKVYGTIKTLPTEVKQRICREYQAAKLRYQVNTPLLFGHAGSDQTFHYPADEKGQTTSNDAYHHHSHAQ